MVERRCCIPDVRVRILVSPRTIHNHVKGKMMTQPTQAPIEELREHYEADQSEQLAAAIAAGNVTFETELTQDAVATDYDGGASLVDEADNDDDDETPEQATAEILTDTDAMALIDQAEADVAAYTEQLPDAAVKDAINIADNTGNYTGFGLPEGHTVEIDQADANRILAEMSGTETVDLADVEVTEYADLTPEAKAIVDRIAASNGEGVTGLKRPERRITADYGVTADVPRALDAEPVA